MAEKNDIQSKKKRMPRKNETPESREKELIALAYDAVEERIRERKASASEYVHFLKLGTEQAKLEREKLAHENKLLEAKTDSIKQQGELKELFENAISAIGRYQGRSVSDEDFDDY